MLLLLWDNGLSCHQIRPSAKGKKTKQKTLSICKMFKSRFDQHLTLSRSVPLGVSWLVIFNTWRDRLFFLPLIHPELLTVLSIGAQLLSSYKRTKSVDAWINMLDRLACCWPLVWNVLFLLPVSNVSCNPLQRFSCLWPTMEAAVHHLQRARLSTIPAVPDTCSPSPHLHTACRRVWRSMWKS